MHVRKDAEEPEPEETEEKYLPSRHRFWFPDTGVTNQTGGSRRTQKRWRGTALRGSMGIELMSPPLRNLKCFSPVMCQCKVVCSNRSLSLMFGCKVSQDLATPGLLATPSPLPVFSFSVFRRATASRKTARELPRSYSIHAGRAESVSVRDIVSD
ncbi:hypothetical protein SKAU_G00322310 [Synaphobranchus kaupii]|uniref:Uncharacterized protein n=1 Tax=Synaphobranchus kaupii TaxID=118154 RepID=A0A9Q1EP47_SYNKA|nr:hypothetical protein SKAU_G00322310 [Synaphobranchus kaupii]